MPNKPQGCHDPLFFRIIVQCHWCWLLSMLAVVQVLCWLSLLMPLSLASCCTATALMTTVPLAHPCLTIWDVLPVNCWLFDSVLFFPLAAMLISVLLPVDCCLVNCLACCHHCFYHCCTFATMCSYAALLLWLFIACLGSCSFSCWCSCGTVLPPLPCCAVVAAATAVAFVTATALQFHFSCFTVCFMQKTLLMLHWCSWCHPLPWLPCANQLVVAS